MAVVNILAWVIVGGIAGWLASLVVRGSGMALSATSSSASSAR